MGSGVSVPADSITVAELLSVLPEEEREKMNISTPTKHIQFGVDDDDQVPHQIKMKVARLVMSAMANSPEGHISMNSQVLQRLADLPRLLNDIEGSLDPDRRRDATEQVRRFLSIEKDPPIQVVIDAGCVPTLVGFLTFDKDPKLQLEAGWALTNIASGTSAQTDIVIDAGALPCFVRLLKTSRCAQVREQAIWALGNIAGDSAERRDQTLATGCLAPLLSELLSHVNNPAGGGSMGAVTPRRDKEKRDGDTLECSSEGSSSPASPRNGKDDGVENDDDDDGGGGKDQDDNEPTTTAQKASILRNGAWLLSNLCRGNNPRVDLRAMKPCLPVLAALVERSRGDDLLPEDEETLTDALWAVSYLSDGEQENIDAVLSATSWKKRKGDGESKATEEEEEAKEAHDSSDSSGGAPGTLVRRLLELLAHGSKKVQTPALRCVGNLVTGDDASTEAVVRLPGSLRALRNLIVFPSPETRDDGDHGGDGSGDYYDLDNDCGAGGREATEQQQQQRRQRQHVVNPRKPAVSSALMKEACWTLSNITAGTPSQVQAVLDAGVLTPLLALASLDDFEYCTIADKGVNNQPTAPSSRYRNQPHRHSPQSLIQSPILTPQRSSRAVGGRPSSKCGVGGGGALSIAGRLGSGAADVQKEAVWAVANAASGGTKKQVRHMVRLDTVRALCTAFSVAPDPRICSVAIEGLTQIIRKAGGTAAYSSSSSSSPCKYTKGFGVGSVVRGTPAYRWRRRVVKAVRKCGGNAALKRLVVQYGGQGGKAGGRYKKSGCGGDGVGGGGGCGMGVIKPSAANKAGGETAAKAQALLGLLALTKEVLSRARNEARRGERVQDGDEEEEEEEEGDAEDEDEGDDDGDNEEDETMNEEDREEVARLVARLANPVDGVGGSMSSKTYSKDYDQDDSDDNNKFEGGGLDEWGDEEGTGGGGGGPCSLAKENNRYGEFEHGANNQTPARVVVIGARKTTPTGGNNGAGAGGVHEVSSGGKVTVRRLGSSRQQEGGEGKEENIDGENNAGGQGRGRSRSDGAGLREVSNQFAASHVAEAMEALERELGLVQLSDEAEDDTGKRGWSTAWGV